MVCYRHIPEIYNLYSTDFDRIPALRLPTADRFTRFEKLCKLNIHAFCQQNPAINRERNFLEDIKAEGSAENLVNKPRAASMKAAA